MASAWTVLFWAAMALFLVDLAWLYASQFLYYIFYGTKYDTVPWLLSWMTNDAFIVTPGVDTGISASGNDGFTAEQWQQIYNLLLLEWIIITLINQSTVVPPLAAEAEAFSPVNTEGAANTATFASSNTPLVSVAASQQQATSFEPWRNASSSSTSSLPLPPDSPQSSVAVSAI